MRGWSRCGGHLDVLRDRRRRPRGDHVVVDVDPRRDEAGDEHDDDDQGQHGRPPSPPRHGHGVRGGPISPTGPAAGVGGREKSGWRGIAVSPLAASLRSDILGAVSDDPATDAGVARRATGRRRRVALAGAHGR